LTLTTKSLTLLVHHMKLRDHPLMTRKSSPNWPPIWIKTHRGRDDKPSGEIGVLEKPLRPEMFTNRLFLLIRHDGFRYMGSMAFDDPAFCYELYRLLNSHVGRSIKEIGDIDLSYTL
jgi:hypothetical protein